ncbi:MAG: hypothetical protein HXX19_13660 [Rhodoferax sp.]|nr:hypothetical protein [Rhodoferax sp.]
MKGILVEVTSTGTNQYSYSAFRYNWAVNTGGTAVTGIPAQVTTDGATPTPNTIPTGSGTLTKTMSGTTITNLAINGTFPPTATLNDAGVVLTAGVDTVIVNAVRTALSTANNYHYAFTGSVSTPSLADSTKVVTASLDTGSYFDSDETNVATTGSQVLAAKIVGTIKTTATQFAGTFDLSAPSFDGDGQNRQFTKVSFNGDISNLTGANVGKFLTGKLDMNLTNYASFHSFQPVSATNYRQGTFTFVGTLQAPLRPLMTVTLNGNTTGPTTGTATMKYSYGLDVEVNGSTTTDSASVAKPVLTLTNQNGVQIVLDTTAYTGPVTVPTISGTTVWGNIAGGVVNYSDGATESFN